MSDAGYTKSVRNRVTTGSALVLIGRVSTLIATFFINVFLARLLSPEQMGAYFLIYSLAATGAIIAQMGLSD